MKTKYWIVIIALGMAVGFFWGRTMTKPKETIRYIKKETIKGSYPSHLLTPIKVEVPEFPNLPYYLFTEKVVIKDSVKYSVKELDFNIVYQDYITRKTFDLALFDNNKQGEFKGTLEIQFNDLQLFNWEYTPISKETTIISKPIYTPFVSAGMNTFSVVSIGAGLFIRNAGFEYEYLYNAETHDKGHGLKLKYKF